MEIIKELYIELFKKLTNVVTSHEDYLSAILHLITNHYQSFSHFITAFVINYRMPR